MFLVSMLGGVYSRHYGNGGIQIFFVGMVNLYIFVMLFLQYPLQFKFQSYTSSEDHQES